MRYIFVNYTSSILQTGRNLKLIDLGTREGERDKESLGPTGQPVYSLLGRFQGNENPCLKKKGLGI